MKPEEILEKATAGELSGEALTEEVKKLSVEDQAALKKLSDESAAESLNKATALRKERDRANEQKTQAEKDAEEAAKKAEEAAKAAEAAQEGNGGGQQQPAGDPVMSQFRKEQVDKAKTRFKNEHPNLPEEKLNAVFEHFTKIDSGKVDADNIYSELRGAYAFIDADNVLMAAEEKAKREREAAESAEAEAAGAQGGDPTGSQAPKYSEETKKLAKEAGISEEAAAKVESEGTTRQYG